MGYGRRGIPFVITDDSLLGRINEVEGVMYQQSDQLNNLNKAIKRYKAENERLKAENAKLRELVRDMLRHINHPADPSWTHVARKESRDGLKARARELGIEVD